MLLHCANRYLGSKSFAFLNTLTTTLIHETYINTFGQVLEKTIFAINATFTSKAIGSFFKTLSRSIYTSVMIKGGGQGVLKRKNY